MKEAITKLHSKETRFLFKFKCSLYLDVKIMKICRNITHLCPSLCGYLKRFWFLFRLFAFAFIFIPPIGYIIILLLPNSLHFMNHVLVSLYAIVVILERIYMRAIIESNEITVVKEIRNFSFQIFMFSSKGELWEKTL